MPVIRLPLAVAVVVDAEESVPVVVALWLVVVAVEEPLDVAVDVES